MREVAVVRQEHRAGRVGVEPPDGDDARRRDDEVDHCPPSLRVAHGRDDACRLVQEHVCEPLLLEQPPVDLDAVAGLDERVELARSPLTVTRPALIRSSAPRRDATPARARYAFRRMPLVLVQSRRELPAVPNRQRVLLAERRRARP